MQRYGLPAKPQIRETIRIPKGTPLRFNRVIAGGRGVGELTSPKRMASKAIVKTVPLRAQAR
jgi:hypothetical protein